MTSGQRHPFSQNHDYVSHFPPSSVTTSSRRPTRSSRPSTTTDTDSRDTHDSYDAALLRCAIVNLKNITRTNHENNKQLISQLREEISIMVTKVTTATQLLSEAVCAPD